MTLRVAIIAGEVSGDLLGAGLMREMISQQPDVTFMGVGGEKMQKEGLSLVFPISDIAVMGFGDVIRRLPYLFRKLDEIAQAIIQDKPDLIICIDAPDFNHRLAKRLKKAGVVAPIIDYVVPSVWFWRSSRARKMAKYFDHCLCLLPFEPAVMKRLGGPPCSFVGHNAVQSIASQKQVSGFRSSHKIGETEKLLTLLPGSRYGEVQKLLPLFIDVVSRLRKDIPSLRVFIPIVPHLREMIEKACQGLDIEFIIENDEKYALFGASDAALAASGTVALELGLACTPMVVTYPSSDFFHKFIIKFLAQTPSVNLVNIALDEPVVPEMLADNVTVENLYRLTSQYLVQPDAAIKMRKKLEVFTALMRGDGLSPDKKAAQVIFKLGGFL